MIWLSFLKGIGFAWKHKRVILIALASAAALSWIVGFLKGFGDTKRDLGTLVCNEQVYKDQVTALEKLLEIEKQSSLRLSEELNEIEEEAELRRIQVQELRVILNDNKLEDDYISVRTKEFYRVLNEKAQELEDNGSER